MHYDERGIYNPYYWRGQLPTYPSEQNGAPLALTPYKAGKILVNIVLGIQSRVAFAMEGISLKTYNRYFKRSKYVPGVVRSKSIELVKDTDESRVERYLYGYFELEESASEICKSQFAHAQMKLIQGAPTRHLTVKKTTRHRQVLRGWETVTLADRVEVVTEKHIEHAPRLPKYFTKNQEM